MLVLYGKAVLMKKRNAVKRNYVSYTLIDDTLAN